MPPEEPHLPPLQPSPEAAPIERDGIAKMVGEFLREAAVLVAVFIPIDMVFNKRPLTFWWGLAIVGIPAAFFSAGVWLERIRRQ